MGRLVYVREVSDYCPPLYRAQPSHHADNPRLRRIVKPSPDSVAAQAVWDVVVSRAVLVEVSQAVTADTWVVEWEVVWAAWPPEAVARSTSPTSVHSNVSDAKVLLTFS